MEILKNHSLKTFNTFGIDANAREFTIVENITELIDLVKQTPKNDFFILGGGSNILLTKDIDKLVIQLNLKGISIIEESDNFVIVEAMAGEVWHEFVQFTLKNNFGGLENLSLIPGNVGTSPMQNIGAYGIEIKDSFYSCKALNLETFEIETFYNDACKFGYRESVFKNEMKGKYIILSVQFKLTKENHKLHIDYGAIKQELEKMQITNPTIQDVSKAVIQIRESKLPNPKEIGNSGSFFKNPVITKTQFEALLETNPNAPHYSVSENEIKIPAGWLIEQAGFKGERFGDAGVHKNQALVLVNYGNATGSEILAVAHQIQTKVNELFKINIIPEVNII
ncbi:UDP-N-acetylmuramate dehydrogenase [Paenimyroides tangerinum]|uniref:UDP-N-acetylenolpyruvoylglucosamine reductase n=1 Tax=Paenimyroides tangerinum TaxID=2488728 RepID=A0A3P3W867_9FLAO|nr:UDP-N-acetylmuramate dehydrogenase [Paenimyroides tangerinum]RRJ90638.1 UDP-N-acetylmuramate dehydrogenase [Paenimyroides tangerinum]